MNSLGFASENNWFCPQGALWTRFENVILLFKIRAASVLSTLSLKKLYRLNDETVFWQIWTTKMNNNFFQPNNELGRPGRLFTCHGMQ